jgi:hypothetical protein
MAGNVRIRIAGLLAALIPATVHLTCLMTLIFSYLYVMWTYPGSASFNLLGHGFAVMFAMAACFFCVIARRPGYCLLFAVLAGFNLGPNDQEQAIRSMGESWLLLGDAHLFMFFLAIIMAVVFVIFSGPATKAEKELA